MKSAQGVIPIIPDDDTAFAFVEFIHSRGSTILQANMGPGAPHVYVSLMEGARSHIANTDSTACTFSSGCISDSSGESQAFFHGLHHQIPQGPSILHRRRSDGDPHAWGLSGPDPLARCQGCLTLDASSYPLTTDGSRHPHFSADFAYYSLPVLLTPLIQACVAARAAGSLYRLAPSPQQRPTHELATAEFLRIPGHDGPTHDPQAYATMARTETTAASHQQFNPPLAPPPRCWTQGTVNSLETLFDGINSGFKASYSEENVVPIVLPDGRAENQFRCLWSLAGTLTLVGAHSPSACVLAVAAGINPGETSGSHKPCDSCVDGSHRHKHLSAPVAIPIARTGGDQQPPTLLRAFTSQTAAPPQQEKLVKPAITSSKKRAAVGSLSPQIRPLAPQALISSAYVVPNFQDPQWEAKF